LPSSSCTMPTLPENGPSSTRTRAPFSMTGRARRPPCCPRGAWALRLELSGSIAPSVSRSRSSFGARRFALRPWSSTVGSVSLREHSLPVNVVRTLERSERADYRPGTRTLERSERADYRPGTRTLERSERADYRPGTRTLERQREHARAPMRVASRQHAGCATPVPTEASIRGALAPHKQAARDNEEVGSTTRRQQGQRRAGADNVGT
jgi:hypothetical protein